MYTAKGLSYTGDEVILHQKHITETEQPCKSELQDCTRYGSDQERSVQVVWDLIPVNTRICISPVILVTFSYGVQ